MTSPFSNTLKTLGFLAVSAPLFAVPAQAADQRAVASCQMAVAERVENSESYRIKVAKVRGAGRMQTLHLELLPRVDDLQRYDAICTTRRGEVIDLTLEAA